MRNVIALAALMISSSAFADAPTAEHQLSPDFHTLYTQTLSGQECKTDQARTVRFKDFESQFGQRLQKLVLKTFAPEDARQLGRVEIVGSTSTKDAAVYIQFSADPGVVSDLLKRWTELPKRAWYRVTEDDSCAEQREVRKVSDLIVRYQ